MLAVADSSALIAIATCQAFAALEGLYDEIKVPQAVYDEVVNPQKPLAQELAVFLAGRVTTIDASRWVLAAGGLGQGEIEAMALYKALNASSLHYGEPLLQKVLELAGE